MHSAKIALRDPAWLRIEPLLHRVEPADNSPACDMMHRKEGRWSFWRIGPARHTASPMRVMHLAVRPLIAAVLLASACGESTPTSPTATTTNVTTSSTREIAGSASDSASVTVGIPSPVPEAAALKIAALGPAQPGTTVLGTPARDLTHYGVRTVGEVRDVTSLESTFVALATSGGTQGACGDLKATPPGIASPMGGVTVHGEVVLRARNAVWAHADQVAGLASLPFMYKFELYEGDTATPLFGLVVQEGADGTTTHTVAERFLTDGTSYRWRVVAEYSGYSCRSDMGRFRTPQATIAAPIPVLPANGATELALPVEIRVENGKTTGDVGTVTMRFDVASSPSFDVSQSLDIAPVPVGDGHTTVSVPASLAATGTTYYWRAMASGARGIESPYSEVWSFTTAASPPGGEDIVSSGRDAIDASEVRWLHTDVSGWERTSTITSVRISDVPAGGICIDHTQARSWPGIDARLGIKLAGNPWVFARIGGVWYGATYEWLRPGQTCKLTDRSKHDRPSRELGPHTKQSPLSGWIPKAGEKVGFMVSTLARFGPEGDRHERSDIVLVTWP